MRADQHLRMVSVLLEVEGERHRQHEKWGEQNHPSVEPTLIHRPGGCTGDRMCEHYEIPSESRAKAMCERAALNGVCTYADILIEEVSEAIASAATDETEQSLRGELVQVAAVAVAWIEAIDRRKI